MLIIQSHMGQCNWSIGDILDETAVNKILDGEVRLLAEKEELDLIRKMYPSYTACGLDQVWFCGDIAKNILINLTFVTQ